MVDRPRCLDWTPLATQQLRLRNLIQIVGYNVDCCDPDTVLYYTLHLTPMSSPFYKSVEIESHPGTVINWPEINCDKIIKSPAKHLSIRVWQRIRDDSSGNSDRVLFVWGVYFSGLVPVVKKSEAKYKANTLVFIMHGGQFASADSFETEYAETRVAFPLGLPHYDNSSSTGASNNFSGIGSSQVSSLKSDSIEINGKRNCDEHRIVNKVIQMSSTPNKNLLAIKSSPDLASFLWNGSPAKSSPLKSPSSFSSMKEALLRTSATSDKSSLSPLSLQSPSTTTTTTAASSETATLEAKSRLLKYRYLQMEFKENDCRPSYTIPKLLQLNWIQRRIQDNQTECEKLRDRIYTKSAYCLNLDMITNKSMFFKPPPKIQPGMGKQLSRLLYQAEDPPKPEDILRGQELRRQIEVARFRSKGLRMERDRMQAEVRKLENKLNKIANDNVMMQSETMSRYRLLSKEKDALLQTKQLCDSEREVLEQVRQELHTVRRRLVHDIRQIYHIYKSHTGLYLINNVPLPNAETYRSYSVSPADISVALGFVSHAVILSSSLLGIPLRNKIICKGSASKIEDNVKPIPAKDREFPLFSTKNPPTPFLDYGVYLLNQNIAQLKFYLGLHRGNSRATLANFLDIMDNIPLETTKTCLLAEQAASVSGSSSADLVAATTPPLKQSQDNIDGNEYQDERHSGDGSAMTLPVDIAGNRAVRPSVCRSFDSENIMDHRIIPVSSKTVTKQISKQYGSVPNLSGGDMQHLILQQRALGSSSIDNNTSTSLISECDEQLQ